jgi:hypothetical protein
MKHCEYDIEDASTDILLRAAREAPADQMAGLLVELLSNSTAIREDAPTKYVYDARLADLRGHLRADGFEVLEDALVRLVPAAEPVAQIRDELDATLPSSDLDGDGAVRQLLRDSHLSCSRTPPDFNAGTTQARIALETLVRRSAAMVAARRGKPAPADTWGAALFFLRSEAVIEQPEEEALAKVYTLISPGAHVPKGLTTEQWALLARTFAVSGAYFVVRQHLAA